MATDFTATTSTISADTYLSTSNPDAQLTSDDFMTLLLTELQYQDPTDPMDSETMLTQTSQMSTLSSTEETNQVMQDLASQISNNMNTYAISAVGKVGSLGDPAITLTEGSSTNFEMYYKNEIESGTITVTDSSGNIVRTVNLAYLGDDVTKQGTIEFEWDGTNNSGEQMESGTYYVTSSYTDTNGEAQTTQVGNNLIESVRFDGDETYIKMGSSYYSIDDVVEYF